jgi:hypothetical protein
MTSIRIDAPNVVGHELVDEPLVTLEALADAADRLPPQQVEHHIGDLPLVLPGGESVVVEQTPGDAVRNVATNRCWVMLRSLAALPEYVVPPPGSSSRCARGVTLLSGTT